MFKEELIIIRHARSKHNVRESDNLDDAITEFGQKQAANVAAYFKESLDLSGHTFYTSPFLRCLQTMKYIADKLGKTPIVESGLREYLNHYKRDVWVQNRSKEYLMDWNSYPDDGIDYDQEFNESFLIRMNDVYHRLSEKSLVVTHGLPAMVLLNIAIDPSISQVPVWDYSLDNCSITIIRKGRIVWRGRNLCHEIDYDSKHYHSDLHGVHKK